MTEYQFMIQVPGESVTHWQISVRPGPPGRREVEALAAGHESLA